MADRRLPHRLLLTGFGPFAGVVENASGILARRMARVVSERWPHVEPAAAELPTEWRTAPQALAAVLERHRPHVVLHLGISPRAQGLVIETQARNRTRQMADADGRGPVGERVLPGAPRAIRSPVAVDRLMRRLAREGIPARRSNDAGRFICNAVYFHSLDGLRRAGLHRQVLLVHLPAVVGGAGLLAPGKAGGSMAEEPAVAGLIAVLDLCLGAETRQEREPWIRIGG